MQFVYMCRNGENEELRYSIRSVLKFFPDADIWLVGGKPSWYVGNHIAVPQHHSKYSNVKNNIDKLLLDKRINDSFIYMNDDFYFTAMPDFSLSYHRGEISTWLDQNDSLYNNYNYYKLMLNTEHKLKKLKVDPVFNYELHIPIEISKANLRRSYGRDNLWRSFYGNLYLNSGIAIDDCKIYVKDIKDGINLNNFINEHSPFLSSNDDTFDFLLNNYLLEALPDKSKCES